MLLDLEGPTVLLAESGHESEESTKVKYINMVSRAQQKPMGGTIVDSVHMFSSSPESFYLLMMGAVEKKR